MDDEISIDHVVEVLNSMLAADPVATKSMFMHEVACNENLLEHPTIGVRCSPEAAGDYSVTPLGLINGFFELDRGWGRISMVVDKANGDDIIVRFEKTPEWVLSRKEPTAPYEERKMKD